MIKRERLSFPHLNLALISFLIFIPSFFIPLYYQEELFAIGKNLLSVYGQGRFDIAVFLLTFVSSTPLTLPVWTYAVYGTMLGYEPIRLLIIISFGSVGGSTVTYLLGRYFGSLNYVQRKFPNLENHPWANGKSFKITSVCLCFGNFLPVPIDIFYAVCGAKKYPMGLFLVLVFIGKFFTYSVFVFGWGYIQSLGIF